MTLSIETIGNKVRVRHTFSPNELGKRSSEPTSEQQFLLSLEASGLAYPDGFAEPGTAWILTPMAVRFLSERNS